MRIFLVFIVFVVTSFGLLAQNAVVDGRMSDQDTKKRMGGVVVTVYKDGKQIAQSTSASNGSYSVSFPVPGSYKIEYTKPGFTSKFMMINTAGLSDEDMPIGGKIFPPIDIDLFSDRPNADMSFMKTDPVVDWNWDGKKLFMDWDRNQAGAMKKRIEDALEKAEKAGKENEAKYNQLIKDADAAFAAEKYEDALKFYMEAIGIPGKASESHPNSRIVQIDDILTKRAKEEMAAKQADEGYNNVIAAADLLKKDKKYDQAEAKYKEALKMKPGELHPTDMIKEIEAIRKAELNRAEYESMIEQGDKFFKQNSLQAARDKYKKAAQLDPTQGYPVEQMNAIDAKLKEQEEQLAKKKKYDETIVLADKLFNEKKYQEAKVAYQEAIKYESAATYPVERIKMADAKIKELEEEAVKEQKFQDFVKQGNEALSASQYDEAIAAFDSALKIKKDPNAEKQLQIAKEGKAKMADSAAKQAKIEALLVKADGEISAEKWEDALTTVGSVLGLEANNTKALEKKKHIEAAIKTQQDLAEKQQQFDNVKLEADALFGTGKFAEAKAKYEAANKIIPNVVAVTARIAECQQKLDESNASAKLNEQIKQLVESGDKALDKGDFTAAIKNYEDALALDKARSDIQEKVKLAQKKKSESDDAAAQKKKFDELKGEGDKLFSSKSWLDAKSKYTEAKKFGTDVKIDANLEVIEQELAKLASSAEKDAKYNDLMAKAAAQLSADNLKGAREMYTEAMAYREKDAEATKKIKEIDEELKKREELASKDQEFKKLKEQGEDYFAQKKWNESKQQFLAAKKLREDAGIDSKLKEIEKELAKLSSDKEREENYKAMIASAEKQENADKLHEAVALYEQAIGIKVGDAHATTKVIELNNILRLREKNAEKSELYHAAMKEGKSALSSEDYAKAIQLFDDALEHKPMDPDAMKQKSDAKKKLEDLSKNEAAYQKLLAEGLAERNKGNLLVAKDLYKQAQQLRKTDPIPQQAIVEIDELLRKKQEEEEAGKSLESKNKQYTDKLELANIAATSFKYEEAIKHLKEANRIKPEEEYPKKKIAEYEGLLEQINAASTMEKNYKDALSKADAAFDKKEYEKSIEFYETAFRIKADPYPTAQIALAKKAMVDLAKGDVNRKYQDVILKANNFFVTERYEDALQEYNRALEIVAGDKFASDRRDETKQILANLAERSAKEKAEKERIDALLKEADALFSTENYLEAKRKYDEVLTINNSNVYALKQVEECVRRAKKKVTSGDDAAYRKIVDKADEYFNLENYDKAKGLYERALKLRSFDTYPKDQIVEIERRLRNPEKNEYELEYLGEEINISIIDGEALFARAEKEREYEKKQGVLKRIFANQKNFDEKKLSDDEERLAFQNEIEIIKDRRNQLVVDESASLRQLAIDLDGVYFSIAQQKNQELTYERSSVLRQNEEIIYILQDFDQLHTDNNTKHLFIADQLDDIVKDRATQVRISDQNEREAVLSMTGKLTELSRDFDNLHQENSDKHLVNADKLDGIVQDGEALKRAQNLLERESVLKMDGELVAIQDDMREDYFRSGEMRKVNEAAIRDLDVKLDAQSTYDVAENYTKIQDLKRQATLAELSRYESTQEKAAIQLMLEEDIALLVGLQSEKTREEYEKVKQGQLEMDQLLVRASDQYKETVANSDDARKETVESIKSIRAGQDAMAIDANKEKYERIQNSTSEVEMIKIQNEEKLRLMDDDLLAISEEIIETQVLINRSNRLKAEDEKAKRETNVDKIEQTRIEIQAIEAEKAKTPNENRASINVIESTIDMGHQAREDEFKKRREATNKLLEDISSNKIVMNDVIANKLGEDYPEGVSQNNFIVKDSKGYPQKITTRRIVVVGGRGDVYLRIQTRNAVTYSKNGEPITEASWIKGTEDNKLTRHF